MKTITITAREFAELYGCSARYVNQVLNRGDLIQFMVSTRRSGSTWLIDVLKDWYESKKR